MHPAEEVTNNLLLALSFLERADRLGADTRRIQNDIECYIEAQAEMIAATSNSRHLE